VLGIRIYLLSDLHFFSSWWSSGHVLSRGHVALVAGARSDHLLQQLTDAMDTNENGKIDA
jgi:hypothetical protein